MKYLSVCSGIEAASVAWHPLGWNAAGYAEIEPFPSAVLAHHFPETPNFGDITKFKEWPIERQSIDILVGGTPCQSFSVAGLRKGLDDPRGNLMLTFGAVADYYKPRWIVWENVPGVLSSNRGRDFGAFLGMLAEIGYGFAYRVLDAQYFGVPQRRRRVFVVGYIGDWRRAAAVLFESESLRGNPPPSRKAGERIARDAGGGTKSHWDGDYPHPTLNQSAKGSGGVGSSNQELFSQRGAYLAPCIMAHGQANAEIRSDGGAPALTCNHEAPILAFAQDSRNEVRLQGGDGQIIGALAAAPGMKQTTYLAFHNRQDPDVSDRAASGGSSQSYVADTAVRRLTPRECERLQGFPDDWTRIPWRGKAAEDCPDGPRYKACGNSMAVPVMAWIGNRIDDIDKKATTPL